MIARNSGKAFLAAISACSALALFVPSASAQGFPQRMHPSDEWSPSYDDRDDDRYDRRAEREDDDRYYDDQREYTPQAPRYDSSRDYRERYDPTYRDRRYDDPDNFGARDTAREPQDETEQNKVQGVDGGPRPVIQTSAPPVTAFRGSYEPGSIVIDTGARKLYYVLSPGSAFAYPIGVGREGFAWTGSEKVSRIMDWPDWYPPAEMRQRKPELPERMLGGLRNPLGAKAVYLGNTLYRIHGTNDAKSIGKAESSGCFRMLNEHVTHLATLVHVGTPVTVVKSLNGNTVATTTTPRPRRSPTAPQFLPNPRDPYSDADEMR